jgi:surfeit locus 1 family protein
VHLRVGSRVFEPRALTTLLALAMMALLLSLGRWQLRRADEKRALYDAFDSGTDATRVLDRATPALPRYQHVIATGTYDSTRQILIDSMSDAAGRVGYYVITPFALAGGGWVLVDRGWVPMGASRNVTPAIAAPSGERTLRGRTDDLPKPGIRLGASAPLAPPYPVIANFPTRAEIAALTHESAWVSAAEVVLLDPGEPDGYLRDWHPPGFPPVRHIAYAVQWFGLALALAVIYVVTNLRRVGAPGMP